MSKLPVLAVDIDDVLAHHNELLAGHYRRSHGVDIWSEEEGRSFLDQLKAAGLSEEEAIESSEALIQSEGFYIAPIQGAIEALGRLKKDYHLIIITSRPLSIETKTREWLECHFPGTFQHVEFVGAPRWGAGYVASKADKFRHHRVDILIDDRLRHCLAAAEHGIDAILFGEYAWNRVAQLPPGMRRAKSWPAVVELLT